MRVARTLSITLICAISVSSIVSCGGSSQEAQVKEEEYTWRVEHGGEDFGFYEASIIDANNIWAYEDLYTYRGENAEEYFGADIYFYNGSEWQKQYKFEGIGIEEIFALDPNHVWVFGDAYDEEKRDKYYAIYMFDGSTWEEQFRDYDELLSDIFALDGNNAWVAGDSIYFFDGDKWVEQYKIPEGFSRVTAADSQHAWARGADEAIYFFDGTEWKMQEMIYDVDTMVERGYSVGPLYALDAEHVWYALLGDYPKSSSAMFFFDGTEWSNQQEIDARRRFMHISASDPDHVWAAGGSVLFYDGSEWTLQLRLQATALDIYAQDESHVWTVDRDGNIRLGTNEEIIQIGARPSIFGLLYK